MNESQESPRRVDRGFTLIEVLIVVITLGLISTVLAATVTVILRTSPTSEVRADDARSLQGLVTWIPQDVDAAPPDGFNTDVNEWACGGTAPANSFSLLSITWDEVTDTTTSYAAAYRYEFDGSEWRIARYSCDDTVTSPLMGPPERQNLTSALPAWDNLAPPAGVTMCDTKVDTAGDCPAGHEILTSTSPDVESLKLKLTRVDGVVSTIDAAPKNPDQDLSDDPNATTNDPPTLSQTNYILNMFAGATVTLDLNTTHNPTDPDADTLSVAIDSSEPLLPGITATTADPLDLTITADATLTPGVISPDLVLIISDPYAGWVDATVTVNIIPEPNIAPTVSPSTYHVQLIPGDLIVLPLDVTHGTFDANGDPLTASWISIPTEIHHPAFNSPGPLDMQIRAKSASPLGLVATPVELLFEDGRGGSVSAWITVEIVAPAPNNAPTASPTNIDIDMFAGETQTYFLDSSHGVNDIDGDPLTTIVSTSPIGITTTAVSGLEVDLTADASVPVGVLSPVNLEVQDVWGAPVYVTITVTVIPTPPPPSDCVLGTVSASPNPVDRQGNGSGPRHLKNDVTVTVNYTGSCDGLVLNYDTGDTSGLGVGTGRVFPPGSPSSIVIYAKGNGGTEKWLAGSVILTASTTSAVTPNSITTTLVVT